MMRKTGVAAVLAAGLLVLMGCSEGSPSSETENETETSGDLVSIEVGVIPIVDVAPIYLGVEQGFFEDEGLELTLTLAQGGAAIVPAVTSGQMAFGFSNVTSMIVGKSKGLPLQMVAPGASTTGDVDADFASVMTLPGSGIEEIADLAGKRVGVNTLNNISDSTMSEAVKQAGGDYESIEFVEMQFPDMPAQLDGGNVDAIAAVEPFVTITEAQGAVPVFSNYAEPIKDLTVAVYFTSDQYAQENPETMEKFVRAMTASLEYADSNPDEVRAVLPTYTSLEPDVIEELTLPRYYGEINQDSLEEVMRISLDRGLIEEEPNLEELLPRSG
ncbi:ABC transporter substrate-binding protein [Arthrobacter sp. zg-Y1110]|uniref:ABC transporter substrate-binding protein n=1 Tax=Arthrobacter sp. zg-Y1110 TaxID=2886932 RepID=UPI001D13F86F|nr:ABC transporter substrate-binding protein [Arthrobacter sp. zg-Y1110]MCC3291868.1 ABC transporter substrate-binding protein [Arthrobacter sp. zg-Y1110]UWX85696.1 ABC transporter substrate-binding protein [Arthrobacter sp. zg-Y1110]